MFKNFRFLSFVFIVTGFIGLSLFSSCNTDVITPPPGTIDSNIHIATLTANEPNDVNSLSGINFYDLKLEVTSSIFKDAQFYDIGGGRTFFVIRPGDLVDDKRYAGFQTKFDFLYSNMSKSRFDTLSKMYYDHTVNPITDFPYATTDTMQVPLNVKPVWSFYLKGKYDGGYNQGKRVYGMFQIDSLYYTALDTFKIRLNIKINKNETDQFNPTHSK